VLAAALLAALLGAPAAARAADADWHPHVAAAREWAAQRHGLVSFAIRTPAAVHGVGLDRTYPSASVVKAMLLVAYLRRPDVRGRALTRGERALLRPMIRRSDNDAATRVRNIVGNGALASLARRVGMTHFATAPSWGSTRITARDQSRYFLHIDGFMPKLHREFGMGLLRSIVPRQRWGIARAVPAGWDLAFKGGWGAGTGAVDHQVGLLTQDGARLAIAVLTVGSPSHAYGKRTEEGIARRLLDGLAGRSVGTAPAAPEP
jgi:hypothetical protein